MITIPNDIVFDEVKKAISKGEKITIPLRGTSMLPTLHEGDLVTLKPYRKLHDFNRNDVFLFSFHGTCILHRFHHTDNEMIVTRGDNLYSFETFSENDIIAILDAYTNRKSAIIRCDSFAWKWQTMKIPFVRCWNYCIRKMKKHLSNR